MEFDITIPVSVTDRFRAVVTGTSIGSSRSDWFDTYEEADEAGLTLAAGMLAHQRLQPAPSVAVNSHTHGFVEDDGPPTYHVTIEKVKEVQ